MRTRKGKLLLSSQHHHDSAATRTAILVAERIFAEAGLDRARTDAIAAAGVNKALLFYCFKSKDGLYRAVLEEHLEDFSRRALAVLPAGGCTRSRLLRYVSVHFDFISARPYFPRLLQPTVMAKGRALGHLARLILAILHICWSLWR